MVKKNNLKDISNNESSRINTKFSFDSYKSIGIDQLVIYSAMRIISSGEECTFERLVFECFSLFPKKFGFQRYPEWPDSSRITKAWLRCRTDKGWLNGTVKKGFSLTLAGEIASRKIENELKAGKLTNKIIIPRKTRERYESVLTYIKNSLEFNKFYSSNNDNLSIAELKSFLGGTLETPKRILVHNLNLYFQASQVYKDDSVLPFLKICKEKLKKIRG